MVEIEGVSPFLWRIPENEVCKCVGFIFSAPQCGVGDDNFWGKGGAPQNISRNKKNGEFMNI